MKGHDYLRSTANYLQQSMMKLSYTCAECKMVQKFQSVDMFRDTILLTFSHIL